MAKEKQMLADNIMKVTDLYSENQIKFFREDIEEPRSSLRDSIETMRICLDLIEEDCETEEDILQLGSGSLWDKSYMIKRVSEEIQKSLEDISRRFPCPF